MQSRLEFVSAHSLLPFSIANPVSPTFCMRCEAHLLRAAVAHSLPISTLQKQPQRQSPPGLITNHSCFHSPLHFCIFIVLIIAWIAAGRPSVSADEETAKSKATRTI